MTSQASWRPRRPGPETLLRAAGKVARLPAVEARGETRRVVNLAADLRESGSELVDVEVADLSKDGFMMRCPLALEPGAMVWLKLAGFAAQRCEVVWVEDGKAGCKFAVPLYPAVVEMIIENQPRPETRRLFTPPTRPPAAPAQPEKAAPADSRAT